MIRRHLPPLLSGLLFGAGLALGGMTNPARVRGFLDIFGDWDPTLAFVMGGAIIPMAIAWRVTVGRKPVLATAFPSKPDQRLGRNLVLGSTLFGMGWGLSGLCPGPSLASISFGGAGGLVFVAAMVLGMVLTPALKLRLDRQVSFA